MHHHGVLEVLFLFIQSVLSVSYDGPDYLSLPLNTIFPGPWENNIRAPSNKSHIAPVKIFNFEGAVSGAESVLQEATLDSGLTWTIRPGGLVTFEFEENIAGKVCFEVEDRTNDPYLILSYSESPFFAGRECDATGDALPRDLPLRYSIKHTGLNCVGGGYNRGAFKYLTVYMPNDEDTPVEGEYWHDGQSAPRTHMERQHEPWYKLLGQNLLGLNSTPYSDKSKEPAVAISAVWTNCTAFPSNPNGRAYTGYFDSSSSLLNRVWYAGAWTLQLSTLDPTEGGSIIDFNRFFDHNNAPVGAWYSNYTIANGSSVTTDGAKRDRMVWPGDMTIAVPGIAVSTYDMISIRNALNTIYDHQYSDGSMPYAGPPMGAFGEFSDTYHLHTLVGTYAYILYSGDLDWLRSRWHKYVTALEVSLAKIDDTGLMRVSSVFDWNRLGMGGHNIEASSLLHTVLDSSTKLASWVGERSETNGVQWQETRRRLQKGISTLFCEEDGLYADNMDERGCYGTEKVLPQDGNSWALISDAVPPSNAYNVSERLRSRWIKYGAPAVEFPNVISPFASSFELLGHTAAQNYDAAVELIELMWGYMLDGPGMTNSTLIEGYRTDGYVHYPAYWAPARNSHAHGWSAGPTTVLMQGILGIKLIEPMGMKWEIEPHLTRWLSYVRGGFATRLGKFEVSLSLMKSLSTGSKIETLEVVVPKGTTGSVRWGGKMQARTLEMENTFSFYRHLDAVTAAELEWQVYDVNDDRMRHDFVKDDTWVKPEVEERPEGVVDWEALEANYVFEGRRFQPAYHVEGKRLREDRVREELRR